MTYYFFLGVSSIFSYEKNNNSMFTYNGVRGYFLAKLGPELF